MGEEEWEGAPEARGREEDSEGVLRAMVIEVICGELCGLDWGEVNGEAPGEVNGEVLGEVNGEEIPGEVLGEGQRVGRCISSAIIPLPALCGARKGEEGLPSLLGTISSPLPALWGARKGEDGLPPPPFPRLTISSPPNLPNPPGTGLPGTPPKPPNFLFSSRMDFKRSESSLSRCCCIFFIRSRSSFCLCSFFFSSSSVNWGTTITTDRFSFGGLLLLLLLLLLGSLRIPLITLFSPSGVVTVISVVPRFSGWFVSSF